ncbi:hypothetical protein D9M69_426700 [compost metagenome]
MIGTFDFYGVYIPGEVLMMLVAFGATAMIRRLLARLGFYRAVWHAFLFNFALYVVVLGATAVLTQNLHP